MPRNFVLAYGDLDPAYLITNKVDAVIAEADPLRPGNPYSGLTASELSQLTEAGVEVYGYVDIAATDHRRPYWSSTWTTTGDDEGTPIAGVAPDWLVKGIPYDFDLNGTIDAYIADYANAAWRLIVINQIQDLVSRGYSGVFLDDYGAYFQPMNGRTSAQNAAIMLDFLVDIREAAGPNFKIYTNGTPYAGFDAGDNAQFGQLIDGMILENYSQLPPESQTDFLAAAAQAIAPVAEVVIVDTIKNDIKYFDFLLRVEALGYASVASLTNYGDQDIVVATTTAGDDIVFGNLAGNTINGGAGNDKIAGRGGADILFGGAGSDILSGGNGTDSLYGGAEADTLYGGGGSDAFHFTGEGAALGLDLVYGGAGGDTVNFAGVAAEVWADLAYAGVEAWARSGSTWVKLAQTSAVENVVGTAQSDQIWGDANANAINGAAGADRITGRAGDDILNGGAGNDVFHFTGAGLGLDLVYGGADGDTVDFTGLSTGVWVDIAYAGVEAWARSGATWAQLAQILDVENVIGTALGDQISGDANANAINGAAGMDIISGRAGADTLTGGVSSDVFKFSAGDSGNPAASFDTVTDFAKGADGIGDVIDFSSALDIGGVSAGAAASRASISAATGVAAFFPGSGLTLSDALADINASFTAGGNAAGEFALFEVNRTGDTYMLISDGIAGIGGSDVLIRLNGITNVGSISLSDGDFMIVI